jgi:hypothetical protein
MVEGISASIGTRIRSTSSTDQTPPGLTVDGGALSSSVLEEFLVLGGSDDVHVFDSCVGRTGAVRSPRTRTEPGPRGVEHGSSEPSCRDRESSRRDSGFALARRVRVQGALSSRGVAGTSRSLGDAQRIKMCA